MTEGSRGKRESKREREKGTGANDGERAEKIEGWVRLKDTRGKVRKR